MIDGFVFGLFVLEKLGQDMQHNKAGGARQEILNFLQVGIF